MKVVIDIPDDNYKRIRELAEVNGLSNNLMGYSLLAIAHGVVLPKGHGDLIDRDETMRTWGNKYFYQGVPLENYIDEVPVVIPADEEGSDESNN